MQYVEPVTASDILTLCGIIFGVVGIHTVYQFRSEIVQAIRDYRQKESDKNDKPRYYSD